MRKISRAIALVLSLVMLIGMLPMVSFAAEGGTYAEVSAVEAGKTYVIVADNSYALTNKAVSDTQLGAAAVTVKDGVITSEVTDDMLWTFAEATGAQAAVDGRTQFFVYDQAGGQLVRKSGSTGTAPMVIGTPGKPNYATWSAAERGGDNEFTFYCNSYSDSDYPFTMNGGASGFNAPGTSRSGWDPTSYGASVKFYAVAAGGGSTTIDFTDAASASQFEIINQASAAIAAGTGLKLVTTKDAFENCVDQLSGTQATTPKDLVTVPVSGNWTATLEVAFDTNGASNGYYQFFGFYAGEGGDYQNMAGIRGGDGAMQNFLRTNGSLVADSEELDSAPGFDTNKTYWFQIVKEGTTYTCLRSNDGDAFDEMFTYEDTGIEADALYMDAYTGMTEGYAFTLKNLEIAGSSATVCEHNYVSVVTEPTCTDKGFTTMTCSKCGKVRIVDEVPALRHNFVDGKCTRCGIEEPDIDPTIPIFENPQYTFGERAADLVARMTPAQKGNQVTSVAPAIAANQLGGGALNVPATMAVNAYHWWSECLHGYSANISGSGDTGNAISYTQNTGVGNSWNPELYYQESVMISDEIRERAMKNSQTGNCIDLNFYSPTVNMHRDPRWGRNEESFSEDVLLNSVMATAFVNGVEGKDMDGNILDPDGYLKAMCTVKHYVANNSERNRLNGGAQTSLRALREYYTAPYRNVIQAADVSSVMTAYSTLNGEPSSYSSYLMDTLLRQTFGFTGHITSDCDSVATETRHAYQNPFTGNTMTDLEALAGSLAHGEDLECTGGYSGFGTYGSKMTRILEAAPETDKGIFTENALDISVWRLMRDRIATGEFDEGLRYTQEASARVSAGNRNEARFAMNEEMNKESVVMLQNKGALPLAIPTSGSDYEIVVVGDWQTNSYRGLYTGGGNNSVYNIQAGIRDAVQRVNPNVKLTYITSNSPTDANKATISAADAVVIVVGTPENYSKEDGDRTSTILPNNLESFISTVGKLNPNSVLIMETCGPMRVKTFQNDVNAILWNSFGGVRKGAGFGAIITGEVNPSGKITDTWYQNVADSGESDIPSIYDYDLFPSEGKNGRTYMYYNGSVKPSYVFGYGLSYTTFAYSNLKINKTSFDANDTVEVSFDVKNTGKVAGKEITQLYIAQPDAPAALKRPIKRLEGFDKIELQPGETKTVEMEVKIPDLVFYNEAKDCYEVDTGKYQVQVGTNSEAAASLTKDFTVSGTLDEYPVLLTVKANQKGDSENGIEERLIYDRNTYVNPQLTVAMNNEKLYGYIIANQQSPIKKLKSCALPEGMTFTYESNRPSVARVEADGRIKTVGAGVATITVTGTLDGVSVSADFVVYVMGNSYLQDITLDGKPLEGFNREKHGYELSAADFKKAPVVAAVNEDPELDVTVSQFTGIPGYAVVTAKCDSTNQYDEYRIGIGGAPVATDFAKGWADAQKKNWTVLNGNANAVFGANGLTITGEAGTIAAGSAKNVYTEPAFGEWVAQTNLKLAAAASSSQQAGMVVLDTADNNVQLVVEGTNLRAYSYVDGTRTQVATASIGSTTEISLQTVKQGSVYSFRYSLDGQTWTDMSGKATVVMGYPQVGVFATGSNVSATFDGIDVYKVTDLYPRLSSITVDGKPLGEFDPEVFVYSVEVATDATAAPVVAAKAADSDLRVEVQQAAGAVGKAIVNVFSDASSATYTLNFNRGPENDYFADGSFSSDIWEVLREDKNNYQVNKGEGIVLPTQQADIYSTGAAWKNVFVQPAMGNWVAVAKMVYPKVPTADYQQAMFLVWEDEDNYIRMNCQQSQLRMEPGVETAGSFNGNLGSGNASAAADGTVTVYFMIEKSGNDYSVGYSQNGTAFQTLGTARNVAYTNPQIGLFVTQNSSSTPINANFEYVYIAARNGVRPDYDGMLTWACQNVADYVVADLPATATESISFDKIPHGYTMEIVSSDPNVISADGVVKPGAKDKNVELTVTVREGDAYASAKTTVLVPGSEGGCDHDYTSKVVAPTCTEAGYTEFTCSKCGDKYTTSEVAALGHAWDKGVVTKEATETKSGVKTFTCTRCGETREEAIPATGAIDMSSIDFTKADAASRFEVVNQTSTAIREGEGLYLVSTKEAVEDSGEQLTGDAATTPRDAVLIPVKGDWTATMKFKFDQGSSRGYYEFFGFYAKAGDDYNNMVGIRGADGDIQDFLRLDGVVNGGGQGVKDPITGESGMKAAGEHWFRIAKTGDTYVCTWSVDGENFVDLFTFEETGIEADQIFIDAYSGMEVGYNYLIESLDFEVTGIEDIDFTDPASADRFEIANQSSAAIAEGTGIRLVTTTDAFEDCVAQLEGTQATTPKDVILVPVEGDWAATLEFDADLSGSNNGYYQFFGFYCAEGDDYQNMAGIRGGDGALQDFLRIDGAVTADTDGVKSAPGIDTNTTYWFKIVKKGTDYTCYRSADGEAFDEMFSYTDTGIEADKLVIDAYTGMTQGYAFTLKSLTFGAANVCEHKYEPVVTAPTCTKKGYTTYTCSKCGKSYKDDEVKALGHDYKEGVCTRCGAKDPTYNPDLGEYTITAPHVVKVDKLRANAGETVTVTADDTIMNVTAADKDGKAVTVTRTATGYTFKMPESNVTLKTFYKKDAIAALQDTWQQGNPFLPLWDYNPDTEPHVFEDPDHPGQYRLYFCTSHDMNKTSYCSNNHVLYSCPVDDPFNWTYHGVIVGPDQTEHNDTLYAPDMMCVEDPTSPTGKYYYYIPCNQSGGRQTMILRSSRPDGKGDPFTVINWSDNNHNNTKGLLTFDPSFFVDDDGSVYGYWGGYNSTCHGAQLDPATNFTTAIAGTQKDDMLGDGLQGNTFGFYEASSMRKVGDTYVFVYSRVGKSSEPEGSNYNQLGYAYSDSPLGPWTFGGIVVDAQGEVLNPSSHTRTFKNGGNTHGSIVKLGDQWYVSYHRNVETNARQAMFDPIEVIINDDGSVTIQQAEMTSQGFYINGLNPYAKVSIGTACYFTGDGKLQPLYEEGTKSLPFNGVRNNTILGLKYFDFNTEAPEGCSTALNLDLIPRGNGTIHVWLRPESDLGVAPFSSDCIEIAQIKLTADMPKEMTTIQVETPAVDKVDGKWGVFYSFSDGSGDIADMYNMQFEFSDHEHKYTEKVIAPTCLEGGHTEGVCSVCGKKVSYDFTEALGHDWDDGKVTTAPTTETPGVLTITCKRCGETKTKRIPKEGSKVPENIDFTDSADADKFSIANQESSSQVSGTGIRLVTTTDGFEPANDQLSGSQATTPKDVVIVPVDGDWIATLTFDADLSGASNGYYQFFGFYAAEGDDYQNMAGIRGGDGALQNFTRINGVIDAESNTSAPGLDTNKTYYFRIAKDGDNYTCYRSNDGEEFTEMFSYDGTGIEADKLIIDAYTGMTAGYAFTLKSLEFEENGETPTCEHDYKAVKTDPTCTEQGYTTYTCSKCGNSYIDDIVPAKGHSYVDGKCVDCGAADPDYKACPSKVFTDAPEKNNWAHEGIDYCINKEYMNGVADGVFNPAGNVTRAQLVTILYRVAGKPEIDESKVIDFDDVEDGLWYSDAIAWASANDIVKGVGENKFNPSGAITREQIATIFFRYAEAEEGEGSIEKFPDAADAHEYAVPALAWAVEKGIISGVDTQGVTYLRPRNNATRAQIATIIMRYLDGSYVCG